MRLFWIFSLLLGATAAFWMRSKAKIALERDHFRFLHPKLPKMLCVRPKQRKMSFAAVKTAKAAEMSKVAG
jgi:hypothetical protein